MVSTAVLSDAPTLTTGFGRTTSHIAGSLARAGHKVDVIGLKARPEDVGDARLPYAVWPAEAWRHWTKALPRFFAEVGPDVLILNMDAYNALECLEACAAAGWAGPTVSYVCFDGLPIAPRYVAAQRRCAAVWASSPEGGRYLRECGVEVSGVATPGVDRAIFRPHPDRDALRHRAGLNGVALVGAFATNTERKQLDRLVDGFAIAAERLPALDLRLYLHCASDGHCDLRGRAAVRGVGDRVAFAADGGFDEHRGLAQLKYAERLQVCDVVVNVPHSGDIEQVILEAQACGIPLLHTADNAVMSQAMADGGFPLAPSATGRGRIGQRLHFVDPATIAKAIAGVIENASLRGELTAAGLRNASRYSWDILEHAARNMVAPFVMTVAG
jgi:glycosyltransferase involved in cell wall biosynthesis